VQTVALQVPSKQLAPTQPTIGIWSDTQRRTAGGGFTQVSRLGMPLVNEVVIPLKDKDKFNASIRARRAVRAVRHRPGAAQADPGHLQDPGPGGARKDLIQVFLTGVPGSTSRRTRGRPR